MMFSVFPVGQLTPTGNPQKTNLYGHTRRVDLGILFAGENESSRGLTLQMFEVIKTAEHVQQTVLGSVSISFHYFCLKRRKKKKNKNTFNKLYLPNPQSCHLFKSFIFYGLLGQKFIDTSDLFSSSKSSLILKNNRLQTVNDLTRVPRVQSQATTEKVFLFRCGNTWLVCPSCLNPFSARVLSWKTDDGAARLGRQS